MDEFVESLAEHASSAWRIQYRHHDPGRSAQFDGLGFDPRVEVVQYTGSPHPRNGRSATSSPTSS